MRIIVTTLLEISEDGSSKVIETTSRILQADSAEMGMLPTDEQTTAPSTRRINAQAILTASNLRYYYLSLGLLSPIQLPQDSWIHVRRGNLMLQRRTHRTQMNRLDAMKLFLDGFSVGDVVELAWDESTQTLEFLDSPVAADGQ